MVKNDNYPWYLQTSPVFSALYDGIYNVGKNISCLDAYKVFFPKVMANIRDNLAALKGLNIYATLWQLQTEISSIQDALIYNNDKWSQSKKWDGETTGITINYFLQYIKMKNFIYQQPLTLNLIHEALEILLDGIEYTATVNETEYEITINIYTENEDAYSFMVGLTTTDKTLFGKPIGRKITYSITGS